MINSFIIKTALMQKYRFDRGFVCCDEVTLYSGEIADVWVDTGTKHIEIEIKTSKADLKRDSFKKKHKISDEKRMCNEFYICVPEELKEDALEWVENTNKKYGVIFIRKDLEKRNIGSSKHYTLHNCVETYKRAKKLHNEYKPFRNLYKRLSSALTTKYMSMAYNQLLKEQNETSL